MTGEESRVGRTGLQGAIARVRDARGTADVGTGPLVPLSEALHWIYACDEWLTGGSGQSQTYLSVRRHEQRQPAMTVVGLICARGRMTHQLALGGEVVTYGWGQQPWGTSPFGGGVEWTWRATLPPDPDPRRQNSSRNQHREACYTSAVAGQQLMPPLEVAEQFLLQHLPS